MKINRNYLIVLLILLTSSITLAHELDSPEYYEGKWNVTVLGTPQGDATIPMRFETKDGVTKGYFIGDPSGEESMMDAVTITETGVLNASLFIGGYDVKISLSKLDEDKTTGNMLGMFTMNGERVKE